MSRYSSAPSRYSTEPSRYNTEPSRYLSRHVILRELTPGNALYTVDGFSKHAQCTYDYLASIVAKDRYITEVVLPFNPCKLYLLFYSKDTDDIAGCKYEMVTAIQKLREEYPGVKLHVLTCHRPVPTGGWKYLFQVVTNVVFEKAEDMKPYIDLRYSSYEFINRRVYNRFCYLTCINQSTVRVGEINPAPLKPDSGYGDPVEDVKDTFVTLTTGPTIPVNLTS